MRTVFGGFGLTNRLPYNSLMATWIKICGVRTPEIARAAADAGADAVGLVFAKGSPRLVTADEARAVVHALPQSVEPVGLFVDATAEDIRRICGQTGIQTVQLHGRETPDFAAGLAPLRVFKALHYRKGLMSEFASWLDAKVGAILIDTPPRGPLRGGGGEAFSWSGFGRELELTPPPPGARLVIAGGLTPANVPGVMRLLGPFGVDVSSGVESSRGVKDARLIREFCKAIRAADSA